MAGDSTDSSDRDDESSPPNENAPAPDSDAESTPSSEGTTGTDPEAPDSDPRDEDQDTDPQDEDQDADPRDQDPNPDPQDEDQDADPEHEDPNYDPQYDPQYEDPYDPQYDPQYEDPFYQDEAHPHDESQHSAGVPGGLPPEGGTPDQEASGGTSAGENGDTLAEDWTAEDSWFDAPESDEERPLVEHLEEMFRRAAVVLVVLGVGTALALPTAEFFITLLWDSFLPAGRSPRIYGPLELVLTELKVAALAGFVLALPALVYESYLFMRPGLYKHERRYYLASVPTSLILAVVGILFSYAVVLPVVFAYFTGYTQHAAEVAFGLKATFDLILIMLGWFALIFQIPLFVMLAIMMGLTSRQWMENQRVYFWGAFLGVAFLFSPDPTGMAPVMVAATMVGLFEGTLLLLRWTSGETGPLSVSALLAVRPVVWIVALGLGYLLSPLPAPGGIYGALPAVLRGVVAEAGLRASVPFILGGGLLAAYEAFGLLARRVGAPGSVRRVLYRFRIPAWLGALVIGSLAAPEPVAIARVGAIDADPAVALLATLTLATAFEALLAWSERRARNRS